MVHNGLPSREEAQVREVVVTLQAPAQVVVVTPQTRAREVVVTPKATQARGAVTLQAPALEVLVTPRAQTREVAISLPSQAPTSPRVTLSHPAPPLPRRPPPVRVINTWIRGRA